MRSYLKFGPMVQVEISFKEKVYARRTDAQWTTDDGCQEMTDLNMISIAHLEPSAQVS